MKRVMNAMVAMTLAMALQSHAMEHRADYAVTQSGEGLSTQVALDLSAAEILRGGDYGV